MTESFSVETVALIAGCLFLWSLVSGPLERWNVTAPMAFLAAGLVLCHGPLALIHLSTTSGTIRSLAELTLALVLFSDASRVNVAALRADLGLPVRLLGIGLPLTIGAGTAAAFGILPGLGIWAAALVGAIVAPTDASLGSAVVLDKRIPRRVRRLLNVESGLNDGIATPFVNLFLAGALSVAASSHVTVASAVRELLIGAGVGISTGLAGGWLLHRARTARWSEPAFQPFAVLALALAAYAAALVLSGNGFVAAFVAGVAFGAVTPADETTSITFTEDAGGLLSLLVWFAFGAVMIVPGLEALSWHDWLFAVLALTLLRMAPVALALLGSGLDRSTVLFVGWFGPRGLASVVFGLLAFDALPHAEATEVLAAVTLTVVLSVVAHGVTANPLARRYGAHASAFHQARPEHSAASSLRTRRVGFANDPGRDR